MSRDDLDNYADGRPVKTTINWHGGRHTQVWHPDPLHPDNFSQVLVEQQTPGWRIAIITAHGYLDILETDS